MKLFFDNIQVAHQVKSNKGHDLVLEEGVKDFFIPKHLFTRGRRSVPIYEVIEWLGGRIFPEERIGAEELLKELGLDSYNPIGIAKETKASLIEDGWWVSFSEEDSFRKSTIRGAAGYPEWELG